jgi:uncharacterized membrane protein YkvA (DUF1232 family)
MTLDEEKKRKALVVAESLAESFDAEEAEAFAKKHEDASWYRQFILLYEMITDKRYKLDKKTCLTIAGALAYVVLPLDVIPDFIPGVGFLDDAFVLGWVIKNLAEELERYKAHKAAQVS